MIVPGRGRKPRLTLHDLPVLARETLGFSGVNLSTDLLAGADRTKLETVRERADRASCACLLLVENDPQHFGSMDERVAGSASERMMRVIEAASILGCSAASVPIDAPDDDQSLLRVAQRLRPVMERAEKLDLNLLIAPNKGLTSRPERVTELLKKVGGFRIGTYPDFQAASESKDASAYLHRLTPYATCVSASTVQFVPETGSEPAPDLADLLAKPVKHLPYDLRQMVDAVMSVGYDGPLGVDYRGAGDVTNGLILSRELLSKILAEASEE